MPVSMLDNFNIRKSSPNVERDMFATVEDMRAYNENYLPQVFIATCVEDGCLYIFNKSNEINPITGRWRKFEGGGDTSQKEVLPTASIAELGNIYQYTGATTADYTKGFFYICTTDGGDPATYSWENIKVQTGGSGGSLENQITATVSVGGVPSGKVYTVGTDLEAILTDLLNPLAYPELTPPSVTLTTTDSTVVEIGSTANATLTATFNRGSISPAYGTSGYRAGDTVIYALNGGTPQTENTFDVTVTEGNYSFVVNAAYSEGEQPLDSKGNDYDEPLAAGNINSSALEFEFVYAWWGNGADASTIEKMALMSKKPKATTINFPAVADDQKETFDVPTGWVVKDIKTFNTFSNKWETCMSTFSSTNVTHENPAGTAVNYTRYFCNLGYGMAARDIKIEWN